jgi:hypothetical protein
MSQEWIESQLSRAPEADPQYQTIRAPLWTPETLSQYLGIPVATLYQ